MTTLYEPNRFGRWVARMILFTPIGDCEWVCNAYWRAIQRWPRLFGRRIVADRGLDVLSNEQVASLLTGDYRRRKP